MNGIMVSEMWSIPRGTIAVQGNQMFVHPSTAMALKHNRTPYWTRHMAGVREMERDRRKHPKR